MVKANFSFGGKLVLVLVTVVVYTFVLIAGAIGGGLYAYNNVKVATCSTSYSNRSGFRRNMPKKRYSNLSAICKKTFRPRD